MSGIKFHPAELILSVLVLRLVIAAFFYHPDIKSQYYHAAFFKTGIINIYEFLQFNRTRLPYSDTFNYPPLTYIFLGSWQTLSSVISGPGLDDWLSDWSDRHLYNPDLFFYLLLLKLPYFIADFLILKLLISLVSPPRRYPLALLWLFNPVSLYAIYAVGQFDIIPALMTVAALTLAFFWDWRHLSKHIRCFLSLFSCCIPGRIPRHYLPVLPLLRVGDYPFYPTCIQLLFVRLYSSPLWAAG